MRKLCFAFLMPSLAAVVSGCASAPGLLEPAVPASLRVPPGASVYLEVMASGVQVYECARKADGAFEWAFKYPDAALVDRAGKSVGKHYAGPTWEAADGSRVTGEVKAREAAPSPSAIPWLLLAAKTNSGAGLLANAKFIQRVNTVAGVAPTGGCAEPSLGKQARVAYTADYFYYR